MQERRLAAGDSGHGVEVVEEADTKGPLICGDEVLKCGGFEDGICRFEMPFPHFGCAIEELRQAQE
jgi:hypothetical protein